MLLSGLDINRCVEGGVGLQLTTRLQAIQPYPYHSGLGIHTLLNGFTVDPFSDMLLFFKSFLIQSYCSSTLRVAPSS